MTLLPSQPFAEEARPGHRPRRLRRLPRLRGELQGVEHRRLRRGLVRPASLRRRRFRRLAQPRPHLRGRAGGRRDRRRGGRGAHRAFPEILPALRRRALRHRLPDRRVLQALGRRHRAGRRGQMHRLRAVRLGLPLWRARDGPCRRRHEEMHAVHRPHLQRDAARGRPRAVLRAHLPGQCPPFRRPRRSRVRGFGHGRRARRHGPDARARDAAGQQISAAAPAQAAGRQRYRCCRSRKTPTGRGGSLPGSTACWSGFECSLGALSATSYAHVCSALLRPPGRAEGDRRKSLYRRRV